MNIKRETAYKLPIAALLSGTYVTKEGWDPNYIEIQGKKVSRVNVMGSVIGKENDLYKLDDGSASIPLRSFDKVLNLGIGKLYLVIGRPREYNQERFLVPEIIREIDNVGWIELRKKELSLNTIKQEEETAKAPPVEEKKEVKKDSLPKQILAAIEQLDEGEGVSMEKLRSEIGECDKTISTLIEMGEIFEIRPGVVKMLS